MTYPTTLGSTVRPAKNPPTGRRALFAIVAVSASLHTSPVRAADGCLVLLCFAAPSWRAIPQCVPAIRQVLRDLARGRSFPSCGMAGSGNGATAQWASPADCPPQYRRVDHGESSTTITCDYTGVVSVAIDGATFSRRWWSFGGDTVTEFTPAAKVRLGSWDTRFDDDYATWLSALPPAPVPGTGD